MSDLQRASTKHKLRVKLTLKTFFLTGNTQKSETLGRLMTGNTSVNLAAVTQKNRQGRLYLRTRSEAAKMTNDSCLWGEGVVCFKSS